MAAYSIAPNNRQEYQRKGDEWFERAEKYDDMAEHCFAYDPDIDAVVINTKHPQYQYQNYRETMIHELAHRIDHYEFGTLLQIQEA